MCDYAVPLKHGKIKKVFDDIFIVTGTMKNDFFGSPFQFSRNMTIVRQNDKLTIFNSVRLDKDGLNSLEKLGKVENVVRLGDMHGIDDAFYINRYNAKFWALPDMKIENGLKIDKPLNIERELPVSNSSIFIFKTVKRPECIIKLNRDGGILIACDALQNWDEPDEYFDQSSIERMEKMNFFVPANIGPLWMNESQPKADDFIRLKAVDFKHALCGHGKPVLNNAKDVFHKTFNTTFNI
jgi:hypothetical protein